MKILINPILILFLLSFIIPLNSPFKFTPSYDDPCNIVDVSSLSCLEYKPSFNPNEKTIKKTIRIIYLDFWPNFAPEHFYFHKLLLQRYNVEITNKNPDYIFYSVFGQKHTLYKGIKIFYTGENRHPNFKESDYAIAFDYLDDSDRYIRFPFYLISTHRRVGIQNLMRRGYVGKKTKFCAQVVSNGNYKVRNEFFNQLSKYKPVDSGGRYLNNVGGPVVNKTEFLLDYKFSLSFENAHTVGYCTEKIIDAFISGTIPVYYGDDEINRTFNSKSFIHVRNEKEFKEKIELIKKIDNDDELYMSYLKEKPILDDDYLQNQIRKSKQFLYHIFDQDIEKAGRLNKNNKADL